MNIPRKLIALLLSALMLLPTRAQAVSGTPEYLTAEGNLPTVPLDIATSAGSAVLLDASGQTVRTLWEQNADKRRGPASTTKIMTALIAAERMPLSAKITVTKEAVGVEGSSVYLTEGEVFTLEELLCCTLLESANDAAVAVAIAVGGSIEDFAAMMNEKCAELDLVDTHFTNPHGLDDDAHYTTARELGIIAAAALENEALRKIFSTYKMTVAAPDGGVRLLINHNRLLRSIEGCIGVKTGYTKSNGRCLVSAAERDGLRIIAVTLDDGNDWHDHTMMLEAGFEAYERVELCEYTNITLPEIDVTNGEQSRVRTAVTDSVFVTLPKSGAKIECKIDSISSLPAPLSRGQGVGEVIFTCGGKEIARVSLVTAYAAAKKKEKGFWDRLFG
ncbi:MAG: D-alanyl-D-alanine carboxypeptidase [Clostridia bacterium]|nr:D-alanyl-D-alanine carboxypeptidase [Clostridia bacterium]